MAREIFFVSWVSEWWIFVFNLTSFASYLSYFHNLIHNTGPK